MKKQKIIIIAAVIILLASLLISRVSKQNISSSKTVKKVHSEVVVGPKETRYIEKTNSGGGNVILVPVIISHNGVVCRANLVLDTGCSTTMLDDKLTNALGFKSTQSGYGIMADGSKVKNIRGEIDYIQVGPYKEYNFTIIANHVRYDNDDNQYGLLGLNFLEKHPFTIDHKKQLIKWL